MTRPLPPLPEGTPTAAEFLRELGEGTGTAPVEYGPEHTAWVDDILATVEAKRPGSVAKATAAILDYAQRWQALPRARCPVCGERVPVVDGVIDDHGGRYEHDADERCAGTGERVEP